MTPDYWEIAKRELLQKDPHLAQLFGRYQGEILKTKKNAFETLVRSIIGQQVSVAAAESIAQRLLEKVETFTPEHLLSIDFTTLKSAGLSDRKTEYLIELSSYFIKGELSDTLFHKLNDEDVITHLTQVRGIGRWTAEMFLIFHLLRPNIFPIQDIGLIKGISRHFELPYPLAESELLKFRERWAPWNTVATWYIWRSLDPIPVEY